MTYVRAMRIVILVLCVALAAGGSAGCTPKQRKWAGLAIGAAGHAADWHSTRWFAARDWQHGREHNPIMGPTPSTAGVDVYFATTGLMLWAASQALPERWRPLAHVAVGAVGFRLAVMNTNTRNAMLASAP